MWTDLECPAELQFVKSQLWDEAAKTISECFRRFDKSKAADDNLIVPAVGVNPQFDALQTSIAQSEEKLEILREEAAERLGCRVAFKHLGKNPFQLEVPVAHKAKIPKDWKLMSQTKNENRYYSPPLGPVIDSWRKAKDELQDVQLGLLLGEIEFLDSHHVLWHQLVSSVAELDCLLSLATTSSSSASGPMCKPEFVESNNAFVELESVRHPILSLKVDPFISNTIRIGGEHPHVMLLTGPNMGGKSSLLRQICLAVIMAQLGCFVPAEKCRLSPFDRIFTRIGANDDIFAGRSTFLVELQETCSVLKNATSKSLVVLDELGRGTSTHDGYAIAYAVLDHLSKNMTCPVLFSTHYHRLTDEFSASPGVKLCHMSCVTDQDTNDVTFLYELADGVCSKSYGMNVARMAGIDPKIVEKAEKTSQQLESQANATEILKLLSQPLELEEKYKQLVALTALSNVPAE